MGTVFVPTRRGRSTPGFRCAASRLRLRKRVVGNTFCPLLIESVFAEYLVSKETPRDLVEAYLIARTAHDHDAARRFLADRGFAFRSPVANFDSADELHEWASLTGGIIQGMDIRKVFVDGDDVCHILTYHYQLSEKAEGDLVHWATVRDGCIQRIEVFFDSFRYRALFDPRLS